MAEKRKFDFSICVKIDAKTAFKVELFDAAQWQKAEQGRYRCRVSGRWHDLPDGKPAYLDMRQALELVEALTRGGDLRLDPEPDIPIATAVSVPNGEVIGGVVMRDITRVTTPPVRGYDGRWYVGVLLYGRGTVIFPTTDLIILPPKRSRGDGATCRRER